MNTGALMTVLGTIESGTGLALRERNPLLGWSLTGIGLAKTVYGIIDMTKEPHER